MRHKLSRRTFVVGGAAVGLGAGSARGQAPAVISSRPAIILKVVVLPQPDGPTRTTN